MKGNSGNIIIQTCWFENSGASWVKSETDSVHRGQGEIGERGEPC